MADSGKNIEKDKVALNSNKELLEVSPKNITELFNLF